MVKFAYNEGYRCQHSTLRGSAKGGLRFHPDSDENEVRALAAWMTIKNAIANILMAVVKAVSKLILKL